MLRFLFATTLVIVGAGVGYLYLNKEETVEDLTANAMRFFKLHKDTEETSNSKKNKGKKGELDSEQKVLSKDDLKVLYGDYINTNPSVETKIPYPKDEEGNAIRQKKYTFETIERDSKFTNEAISKLTDETIIIKRFKEYLILANKDHEVWDVKYRQLKEYLKDNRYAGDNYFGWMKNKTTKEELVNNCHKQYFLNPSSNAFFNFFSSTKLKAIWNSTWDWCSLPEYWGQPKPKDWHQ